AGRKDGPRQSDDEYAPPRLLNRPLVVGPVALVVAALVITPLVVLGSGGSEGEEDRKENARSSREPPASPAAGEPLPTVSVSSRTVPPPPPTGSASPSARPKPAKPGKPAKPDVRSTVTVTARPPRATAPVTAKPARETAAAALRSLVANDPAGRHICYRAYVTGKGWQKPVCDGTMAGTTGQGRPIKALNIAVHGTGGSAANAFVHRPGSTDGKGVWKPKWTAVEADGRNNYIGSTKSDAPRMLGFAVNVGSGRICQTTRVRGADWGGQSCADPRPGFLFGGTLTNDSWLEAVRLTV
ncbi:hydrogenase expression protein HypA, partial [Streptomyces pilosus]